MSPTAETLLLSLPSNPEAPARARAAMTRIESFVSDSVRDDLRLLVTELVSNCVRHADLAPSDRLTVEAAVRPGRVRIEVSDPGSGFEPAPVGPAEPPKDIDDVKVGGFGLALIARLADSWGVRRGPTTRVWFELTDDAGSTERGDPVGAPARRDGAPSAGRSVAEGMPEP